MSHAIQLSEKEVALFEQLAAHLQTGALTPASAKILSLLTVSPVISLTFNQIMDTLSMSKSATSVALQQLQDTQQIEFSAKLGDRKRHFTLRTGDIKNIVNSFIQRLIDKAALYEEILKNRPADTPQFNENMRTKVELLHRIINAFDAGMSSAQNDKP